MEDRAERIIRFVLRIVACYLAAGLVMTVVLCFDMEWHPHVPFSGFPGWLIWTPVTPVVLPLELADPYVREVPARAVVALVLGPITFVVAWFGLRWRARRRR